MSDRDYIAWSLVVAGVLTLVVSAITAIVRRLGWADWTRAAYGRRLQRRLDARLARGEDRYFEELRSIETAIKTHEAGGPDAMRQRFKPAYAALMVAWAVLLGLVLTSWFAHPLFGAAPPKWARHISFAWMPLFGIQQLLDSFQPEAKEPLKARGIGIFALFLGGIIALIEVLVPA